MRGYEIGRIDRVKFAGFRKVSLEVGGVDLDVGQIPATPTVSGGFRLIELCKAKRKGTEGGFRLQETDSQLYDSPIFVTWLTTSLGFPTIAHILPCVSGNRLLNHSDVRGAVIDVPRPGRIRLDPTPKC